MCSLTPNKRAKMASSAEYSIFWVYKDGDEPCNCCNPLDAFENQKWTCAETNQVWYIVDEYTETWGDINERAFAEEESYLTYAQKAERLLKQEADAIERIIITEASRMFNYAESQKLLNSRGKGKERHIGKIDEPCKFLYCNEKAPKSQWTKNAKGESCAPLLKALTHSECWAHEYHHPKTKVLMKPHTCKRLHPNEDGWREEWNKDRTFRIAPPTKADGFFNQRMSTCTGHSHTPPPFPKRQVAIVDSSAW